MEEKNKVTKDEWIAFSMPFVANQSTEIGEMIIDNYNQKWGIKPNNGLASNADCKASLSTPGTGT